MLHVTDLLDIAGIVLLVAAAALAVGLWAALAVSGVGCIALSWGLSRPKR